MNLVNGLGTEMGAKDEQGNLIDVRDAWRFLYRTGIRQFQEQYDITQQLARMLVLYEDLPRTVPRLARYDVAGRFRDITGITIEQFMWCGFGLYMSAVRADYVIGLEWITDHDIPTMKDTINEATVRATLGLMSAPLADIRTRANAEQPAIENDMRATFSFNPLVSTPSCAFRGAGAVRRAERAGPAGALRDPGERDRRAGPGRPDLGE